MSKWNRPKVTQSLVYPTSRVHAIHSVLCCYGFIQRPVRILHAQALKTIITHDERLNIYIIHDDVIKWKHFPRYWPFVRGIHRSPVNSPHKSTKYFLWSAPWINGWINNREVGDSRCQRAHYDVIIMQAWVLSFQVQWNPVNMQDSCPCKVFINCYNLVPVFFRFASLTMGISPVIQYTFTTKPVKQSRGIGINQMNALPAIIQLKQNKIKQNYNRMDSA